MKILLILLVVFAQAMRSSTEDAAEQSAEGQLPVPDEHVAAAAAKSEAASGAPLSAAVSHLVHATTEQNQTFI